MPQYVISGTVVTGLREGTTLGYPTINIAYETPDTLPTGVFAAVLRIDGAVFRGAAVVGGDFKNIPHPKCEVHLLNISYRVVVGTPVELLLCERVSNVERCATLEDLRSKIDRDITEIQGHFSTHVCLPELLQTLGP